MNLASVCTVLPCTAYEDTRLTRLVAQASIYNFGMMTGRLLYSRPGVYLTGENDISEVTKSHPKGDDDIEFSID